jgi:LmbE family N-acetylglucosaminyl deacetylase
VHLKVANDSEHVTDVVVSPHFDDAVLSAAAVLHRRRARALVVTVCGGPPERRAAVSDWDRVCGFPDGAVAAELRGTEDLRALSFVGARSLHLEFVDDPYRAAFPVAEVAAALRQFAARDVRLWVPMGLGRHPDHEGVREASLAAGRASCRLLFYADLPHALDRRADGPPTLEALEGKYGPIIRHVAASVPLGRRWRSLLDREEMHSKLKMLDAYRSQLEPLRRGWPHLTSPTGLLSAEFVWQGACTEHEARSCPNVMVDSVLPAGDPRSSR